MTYQFAIQHTITDPSGTNSTIEPARFAFNPSGLGKAMGRLDEQGAWVRRAFGPGCISPRHRFFIAVVDGGEVVCVAEDYDIDATDVAGSFEHIADRLDREFGE